MIDLQKKENINLIPDIQNPSADYYCTWQTQLYASCNKGPSAQRSALNATSLFGQSGEKGWVDYFTAARNDLLVVLDDGWDVSPIDDFSSYGSMMLDKEKFPSFWEKEDAAALKLLADKITGAGWKGMGVWVCAQDPTGMDQEKGASCWRNRVREAAEMQIRYWKVDWGKQDHDPEFRKKLTHLAKQYAPNLCVEHAMILEVIPFAETFRTYDVPAVMSIPMTMKKLEDIFSMQLECDLDKGIINCEDEVYIAAAGGFTMGVMRHPNPGNLPDGAPDPSFPQVHRNIKTKIAEVTRAVRWHRIAPAFGGGSKHVRISSNELVDSWSFERPEEEIENWWFEHPFVKEHLSEKVFTVSAGACISRGMDLPIVMPDENGEVPYVVAAKNPNGAVSLVTAGRTIGRKYYIPACDVSLYADDATVFGIFGYYRTLTLITSYSVENITVFAQDLADTSAYDITKYVQKGSGRIIIPGEVIAFVGTSAQSADDTSEPGMVLMIQR